MDAKAISKIIDDAVACPIGLLNLFVLSNIV